jgi:hypothetical protein
MLLLSLADTSLLLDRVPTTAIAPLDKVDMHLDKLRAILSSVYDQLSKVLSRGRPKCSLRSGFGKLWGRVDVDQ